MFHAQLVIFVLQIHHEQIGEHPRLLPVVVLVIIIIISGLVPIGETIRLAFGIVCFASGCRRPRGWFSKRKHELYSINDGNPTTTTPTTISAKIGRVCYT